MRKLKKALTYILAAMVVIAVAALCVNIFSKLNYGDSIKIPVYPNVSSQTVTLSYDEDDLNGYDIGDCTAKFVPNVTEGGEYDFEFTVGGESKLFSAETDLSGCFASDDYDGEGLAISADGAVSVNVPSYNDFDMGDILCVNYKYKVIAYPSDVDIYSYPYLALAVYLPSGTELCRTAVEFYTSDSSVIDIDSGETSYSLLSDCTEHVYDYDNIVYCWDYTYDNNGNSVLTCVEAYAECMVCGNCEFMYEDDIAVISETLTKATCETDGELLYTATVIFENEKHTDTKTEIIHAYGHGWNDGEVTTEPTCTETGVITYTCFACSKTYTEDIEATGHDFTGRSKCYDFYNDYNSAYMTVKCNNCGDDIIFDTVVTVETTEAYCANDGEIVYTATVEYNGITYTNSHTIVIEAEYDKHFWNDGVLINEPTCEKDGVITYTCALCGDTKNTYLSSLGHTWDDVEVIKEATCLDFGQVLQSCNVCGETCIHYTEKLDHDFDVLWEWYNNYQNAKLTLSCDICEETKSVICNGKMITKTTTATEIIYTVTLSYRAETYTDTVIVPIDTSG